LAGEDACAPSEESLEPNLGALDARRDVDAPSIPAGIVGLSLTKRWFPIAGAAWQRPYINSERRLSALAGSAAIVGLSLTKQFCRSPRRTDGAPLR